MKATATVSSPGERANRGRLDQLLRSLATLLVAFAIVASTAGLLVSVPWGLRELEAGQLDLLSFLTLFGVVLANGSVAYFIIRRYPRHVVGWLLLGVALSLSLVFLIASAELRRQSGESGALMAFSEWLARWVYMPFILLPVLFIPLYFPDGKLLSRRWRVVALAGTCALLAGLLGQMIAPGDGPFGGSTANPLQIAGAGPAAEILSWLFQVLLLFTMLANVGAVAIRYRRSTGAQRVQMKSVIYLLTICVSASIIGARATLLAPSSGVGITISLALWPGWRLRAGAWLANRHRHRHPALAALRHRPDYPAHAGLRPADRAAGDHLFWQRRPGAVPRPTPHRQTGDLTPGHHPLHPAHRRPLHAAAQPHSTRHRSPLLPPALRRRPDPRRLRRRHARRGGT